MPELDEPAEELSEEEYDKLVELYEPKVLKFLAMLAEMLEEDDFEVIGPWEIGDDNPQWCITAKLGDRFMALTTGADGDDDEEFGPHDVDISIGMLMASSCDVVPDGFVEGLNFRIDIVEYGGRIIAGWAPFNYTDEVWVNAQDPEAVEERWRQLIPEGNRYTCTGEHQAQEIAHMLDEHRKSVHNLTVPSSQHL